MDDAPRKSCQNLSSIKQESLKSKKKIWFVTEDGAINARRQIKLSTAKEEVLLDIIYACSVDVRDVLGEVDLDINNVISDEILVLLECLDDLDINEDGSSGIESKSTPSTNLQFKYKMTMTTTSGIRKILNPCLRSKFLKWINLYMQIYWTKIWRFMSQTVPWAIYYEICMTASAMSIWNLNFYAANWLQLSVRKLLDLLFVKSALVLVRKTCKFYRKSSVTISYLRSAFDTSKYFIQPLHPLL